MHIKGWCKKSRHLLKNELRVAIFLTFFDQNDLISILSKILLFQKTIKAILIDRIDFRKHDFKQSDVQFLKMYITMSFLWKFWWLLAPNPLVIKTHYWPHLKALFYNYWIQKLNWSWYHNRWCHFSKKSHLKLFDIFLQNSGFCKM